MTETLRIVGGTGIDCADGPCGAVGRALVDPTTKCLSFLAIEPTGLSGIGRLVPFRLLSGDGDVLRLDCSRVDFDALDPDEDMHRVVTPGLRPGSISAPLLIINRTPDGTVAVNSDTELHASDGTLGRLAGLVVDAADGRITELLVEEGHLFRTRQISVPGAFISSITVEAIELTLSKSQVETK